MQRIEFWDKQTPINGVPSETILQDGFFRDARSVFLIVDENNAVTHMESVDIIKANNGWNGKTDNEVAAAYLDVILNPVMPLTEDFPATKKELQILGQQLSDLELLILGV